MRMYVLTRVNITASYFLTFGLHIFPCEPNVGFSSSSFLSRKYSVFFYCYCRSMEI